MLYDSLGMLIVQIIEYALLYFVLISPVFFIVINILLGLLKVKSKKKRLLVSILASITLSFFLSNNFNLIGFYTTTKINGKKDSDFKSIINQIIDFKEKDTEIIYAKTEDIKTFVETIKKYKRTRWRSET